MEKPSSTIHLQRLKQLDAYFGTEASRVDSQTLADVMSCSTRNVAKIMKTLNELGWIRWVPGKGRGNKTQLQILSSFHDRICTVLKSYVADGELNEASRYADIFKYGNVFKQHLPEWLADISEDKECSDELVSLVPYNLPSCHPMNMTDRHAGIYVTAMFDTLIKLNTNTGAFEPHLAHQFYQEGLTYYFRIRPDIYFHNGELLTPEHVKQNLVAHMDERSVAHQLYASIKDVQVNRQWVEVTLSYNDPIFLHAIADVHASIFLDNPTEEEYPYGTGAYHWEHRSKDHWSLVKNAQYFAVHGVLKRADFWHVTTSNKTSVGHLFEFEHIDEIANKADRSYSTMGTKALCFSHRLDFDSRVALSAFTKQILNKHYSSDRELTSTILPDRSVPKPNSTEELNAADIPAKLRVYSENQETIQMLWIELQNIGTSIEYVESVSEADLWVNNFLFGADVLLDHYYWLMLSESASNMITPFKQRQWITEFQQVQHAKGSFLQDIENRYLEEKRLVPLWVKSVAFKSHDSLRGTDVDSLGMMNLCNIWFDKREPGE